MVQDPLIKILLLPFSLLYGLGVSLRDFFYRQNLLLSVKFNVPIISVGNLSIGGAGKTPHIEYLIRLLRPYLNVSTLSRGYRRNTQGFQIVNPQNTALEMGDEPLMFKKKFGDVFVTVSESRSLAIPEILGKHPRTQVILLDDAFQHRSVQPGLNILLTEYSRPFTRDFLLPSGRLREWRSAYRRADVIIVTKCPADIGPSERESLTAEIKPFSHQRIFFSSYRYLPPYYILNPKYRLELTADIDALLVCAIAGTDYLLD
ncbi:MAG: tetraacyldisaccharide 4'-kinase, partial [Saprospiraceae bacterium]